MPGRLDESHEVSVSLTASSDHRRNRHAPLLHATEWMEAIYHHNSGARSCNDIPVSSSEEEVEACEPTSARKRRAMYNPQVLRREISVGKSNTTEMNYHLFLRQLGSSLDSDIAPNEVNGISTGDVPSWLTTSANNNEAPLATDSQMNDQPLPLPSHEICSAVAMTITPIPAPHLNTIHSPPTKTTTPPMNLSKTLPPLPLSSTSPSTPSSINNAPITKETALHSHQPSDEEREYSRWLGEGWRVAREQGVGCGEGKKRGCRGRGMARPSKRCLRDLFSCM